MACRPTTPVTISMYCAGRIVPLPEAVVAQIKSSTAIVSLGAVVLELLKNALDARATKIEATVDFARGACVVEDNGLGIAPSEFREDGSLCRIYCTSKHYSEDVCLGRNGTFLASLAAMCLLHVVSHHHENRSHNLLSFYHSKIIDRQLPAQPSHEIHEKHGTRVTVRNLFGNMPVRVKQRAALVEQRAEHDRLWEALRREVTALLLSWRQPVALRVRDGDGRTLLKFSELSRTAKHEMPRSSSLHFLLRTLAHASYIAIDEGPSWIPVSASTSTISIKGAISIEPAPTKRVQFISLGVRPLSADCGHNELFDEVNRIFSLSSFGTVEDDANIDANEKLRRRGDKRFKSEGYTNRQLTARKGVDRYPMYHLRISLSSSDDQNLSEDKFIEDEANLQAVVGVLNAMITQWLSAHHFRPRKPRAKRNRETSPSVAASDASNNSDSETSTHRPSIHALISPSRESKELRPCKRTKSRPAAVEGTSITAHRLPFAQWSRIKSSKAGFLDTMNTTRRLKGGELPIRPSSDHVRTGTDNDHSQSPNTPAFIIPPSGVGSLNGNELEPSNSTDGEILDDDEEDQTITWKDPSTKETFFLNARTGCAVTRPPPRSISAPSVDPQRATLLQYNNKPIRLTQKPITSSEASTPWLSNFLKTWDNPVFKPAEQSIQQMCSHEHHFNDHDHGLRNWFGNSGLQMNEAFSAFSTSTSKLSKPDLVNAQVMAQVDRKFILAKMHNITEAPSSNQPDGAEVIVLIDQHAADERIQVESLFSALCTPLPMNRAHSTYRSKLGHPSRVAFVILQKPIQFTVSTQEQKYFTTHASRFATWGILYDVDSEVSARQQQGGIKVTTLPPAISERCKADPKVLIAFLRSAVWKFADSLHPQPTPIPPPSTGESSTPTPSEDHDAASWVREISTCPDGLVELINSRACRSAIMFNDELSLDECKELVRRLAHGEHTNDNT
ncbi:DNA mismatch repair protein [Massarina eburnea CBS 473.64]|uniref:DNA mismatch repair protein n=1 Tax=Massarina eburnea CBS 473.64 TaxID=1395130 RepID=A0A6A6S6B9_9PLEO|nr:DNA mismatch repair protein [Massarina eburnea CBS 473.64]